MLHIEKPYMAPACLMRLCRVTRNFLKMQCVVIIFVSLSKKLIWFFLAFFCNYRSFWCLWIVSIFFFCQDFH